MCITSADDVGMRSTRIVLVLLFLLALVLGAYATRHVNGDTGRPTRSVEIFEDGSGVQYLGDTEVRTFPNGTFAW